MVELRSVDGGNWREVAAVRPACGQEQFVAPVSEYLCDCLFGGLWRPLGVYEGDEAVGYVQWGVDPEDGSCWIGGLVIDAAQQRRGHGRAVVTGLLERFRAAGAEQAALSCDAGNEAARALYASLGFRETGELADEELVSRLELR